MKTLVTNIGRLVVRASAKNHEAYNGAALLIEDGKVVASGTRSDVEALAKDAEIVDAGQRLVTPGLIDAHTHLVFGGNRANEFETRSQGATYEEIAASGGGILSTVAATRTASEDDLVALGKKLIDWMFKCGTTRIEAKTGYGLDIESELKCLRAIARIEKETGVSISKTLLALHAVPPEFAGNKNGYVQYALNEILPAAMALEDSARPQWVDVFVEKNYFDPEDARVLARAAKQFGLGLRMHVDQLSDGNGAFLASELGAISADHLEHTNETGIQALAKSGTVPILLPASVFCLGKSKYPDARRMLDVGLPVALATDFNPGSSPTPSLPFAMFLACAQMMMTPMEALAGCTVHAARSLGTSSEVGSLEMGMKADFVIWDCEDEREIPFWVGAPVVHQTWIGGMAR